MKMRVLTLILAGTIMGTLAGCGQSGDGAAADVPQASENIAAEDEPPEQPASDSSFTYAVTSDPGNTLNLFTADDRVSLMTAKLLATPLYSMNADGTFNYYVAESIEPSTTVSPIA